MSKNNIDDPVILLKPEVIDTPKVLPTPVPSISRRDQVHVAANLLDLVSGQAAAVKDHQTAKQQQNLNHLVHQLLVAGLILSTGLILFGLALDLILGREVPHQVPSLKETFVRIAALRPSGFLTLGMLVLIATPILRVVGSIVAFIYERDWRYVGITLMVLLVVIASLIAGKG